MSGRGVLVLRIQGCNVPEVHMALDSTCTAMRVGNFGMAPA